MNLVMWTRGNGSKIPRNWQKSFMDGPLPLCTNEDVNWRLEKFEQALRSKNSLFKLLIAERTL